MLTAIGADEPTPMDVDRIEKGKGGWIPKGKGKEKGKKGGKGKGGWTPKGKEREKGRKVKKEKERMRRVDHGMVKGVAKERDKVAAKAARESVGTVVDWVMFLQSAVASTRW